MRLGLDPKDVWLFWLWAGWLWPIALSAGFMLVVRSKLKQRLAFVVLGTLVCYGVLLIVGRYMVTVPAPHSENSALPEQLAEVMLATTVRTNLVSLVVSALPLAWLYAILRTRSASDAHSEQGT